MLIGEKLDLKMDADLARTDPEFAVYHAARKSKDIVTMKKFEKKNPNYLQAKRADWWRTQYKKADMQILDKRYDDVLQNLLDPQPSPPESKGPSPRGATARQRPQNPLK